AVTGAGCAGLSLICRQGSSVGMAQKPGQEQMGLVLLGLWKASPCSLARVLAGRCLLRVPGSFQVVQKIKASGNQVLLAVLDGDSYEAAKALGRDLSQMLPEDIRPRLCHVTRDKSGFGFSVSGQSGGATGLLAAGAQRGQRQEMSLTMSPVLPMQLKQSGNKVTLLVASSAVEEFYRLRGLRVTAALADTSRLPFKVRELHLVKGPAGYGFLLKEDDCQFLWDVDVGLPAEQAGMREGDRVLAVNGESIEGLDHEQTVHRIRAREDQVTLLVIDPAGDEFYHSVGPGATLLLWLGSPGVTEAPHWSPCLVSSGLSAGSWGAKSPCPEILGADSPGRSRAGWERWEKLGWEPPAAPRCGVPASAPIIPSETLPKVPSETVTTVPSKISLCLKSHSPAGGESCPEKQIVRNAITQACSLISLDQSHGDFCTWLSQRRCCPPQFSPQVVVVVWSWPGHLLVVNPA
uniref:PDZ domain-containing protein n=1 Tax=Zonotrichia albicollis TaxID=44394 RepID=A0A8D2MQ39_ZONAL